MNRQYNVFGIRDMDDTCFSSCWAYEMTYLWSRRGGMTEENFFALCRDAAAKLEEMDETPSACSIIELLCAAGHFFTISIPYVEVADYSGKLNFKGAELD